MNSRPTEIVQNERRFDLHELFFSTTDTRGVIQHGNAVFQRISGYPLEQLIGAAHSIVRHPEMPRCVFQLLWDTIRAGKTIAAYVKNLAADGRYYWVMAVVAPCKGGYLSIRLKPTSAIFEAVRELYPRIVATEESQIVVGQKSREQEIAAGTTELMSALHSLGFADYDSFMTQALTDEMHSRYQLLQSKAEPPQAGTEELCDLGYAVLDCLSVEQELQSAFARTVQFRDINRKIMEESSQVASIAGCIRTLSMNAKISAFHGNNSATLQEIAKALGNSSSEVQAITEAFLAQAQSTARVLESLAFDIGIACLQVEVARQFLAEVAQSRVVEIDRDTRQSLSIVTSEVQQGVANMYTKLADAAKNLTLLFTEVERMSRNNKRLSFVQFAGQKEAVVYDKVDSFAVVFKEVREHIGRSLASCDTLFESVGTVRLRTNQILRQRDTVVRRLSELDRHVLMATCSEDEQRVLLRDEANEKELEKQSRSLAASLN